MNSFLYVEVLLTKRIYMSYYSILIIYASRKKHNDHNS